MVAFDNPTSQLNVLYSYVDEFPISFPCQELICSIPSFERQRVPDLKPSNMNMRVLLCICHFSHQISKTGQCSQRTSKLYHLWCIQPISAHIGFQQDGRRRVALWGIGWNAPSRDLESLCYAELVFGDIQNGVYLL